jgi:hypothetical protein
VSQDKVTATLCTEELYFYTLCIALPIYQAGKIEAGEDSDGQHDTLGGHQQLDLIPVSTASDKTGYFVQLLILFLGKIIKPFFSSNIVIRAEIRLEVLFLMQVIL